MTGISHSWIIAGSPASLIRDTLQDACQGQERNSVAGIHPRPEGPAMPNFNNIRAELRSALHAP